MALVTYENPEEFKDVERWFKILPTAAFYALLVSGSVWVILYKIFEFIGVPVVGLVIGGLQCVVFVVLNAFEKPSTEYMKGAGVTYFRYFIRILRHKGKKNRKIYVKNWNSVTEQLMSREDMLKKEGNK